MRPDTTDKRLLASYGVERSVGRFSRLRTPLGLVMRRLSVDRDRETGCIPSATLYSAAMSDRTGMCSPLTTMVLSSPFDALLSIYLVIYLSPSLTHSVVPSLLARYSPAALCLLLCSLLCITALASSGVPLERVISDHVGGCLTRYTTNTLRKWDRAGYSFGRRTARRS